MNKLLTDYPTAWAVMRKTDPQQHHERCSYRQTNGGVLCDCAASAAFIATVEMQGEKSYSELIIEGNEAKKTCGQCGQLCVAYKEKFRKQWVVCLDAVNAFGAMTYKQLADVLVSHYGYKDKAANSTARSFCMARHWLVIEKAGKSIGRCPVYQITPYGYDVLSNVKSIATFLWLPARGIEMDLSMLPQPTYTFAVSVAPDDPNELANKALHVEEAAPAPVKFYPCAYKPNDGCSCICCMELCDWQIVEGVRTCTGKLRKQADSLADTPF